MESPWEDILFERKSEGDLKDLLKTMVAFANSVRPGHTATILIGELDDGTVQGVSNVDNIQKKIRYVADKIYPAIVARWQPYEKDGRKCIKVEIEYSGETPHFGGESWIRKGSETIKATDEMFETLIQLRIGKVRELSKSIGSVITVSMDRYSFPGTIPEYSMLFGSDDLRRWYEKGDVATVISVNSFYVNLRRGRDSRLIAETLDKVSISFDHENCRPEIIVKFKA